jgi:hypothetical protein
MLALAQPARMEALPMRYWVGNQRVAFAVTDTAALCV